MNKSERINEMMIFLNEKDNFNLKDLMERYDISKSTALRDIEALERIGMPIYSQVGRNGYYGLLHHRLLSPILFDTDEVLALYFSMLTLRSYESTPFHLSVEALIKKFEKCLSTEKKEKFQKIEKVFSLSIYQQNKHCEYLDIILQTAIEEKVCTLKYMKNCNEMTYNIQFFNITSNHGQWYATGFDIENNRPVVLRCDRISQIQINLEYSSQKLEKFLEMGSNLYKTNSSIEFEVEISEKAVDLFYKEHYPSMKLTFENSCHKIRGFYNTNEEEFIANYFLAYGEGIQSIYPKSLKQLIVKRLENLKKFVENI